jgi:hypothetical protein
MPVNANSFAKARDSAGSALFLFSRGASQGELGRELKIETSEKLAQEFLFGGSKLGVGEGATVAEIGELGQFVG